MAASRPNPRTISVWAPYICICSSFAVGVPSTTITKQGNPARAQYAARAEPVFPLDVARHTFASWWSKWDTAAAANLSLYEPDGLVFSNLKYKFSIPYALPIRRAGINGVWP